MLKLRPYKAYDAKCIASWIKDEVSFRKWCADRYDTYPISSEDINMHYARMAGSVDFWEMTAFDDSGVVGHLTMRYPDEKRDTLRFGFVIVDDAKRGKGYGKELVKLSLKYAFEIAGAQKVSLGVFENNEAAYYCYKSAGFQTVQKDKKESYEVFGEKWDCIEMEITREQYEKM